jgi:thiol:disulfide interchange protein DsbD
MLDFYADWCVACRIMERDVFSTAAVHAALSGYEVLQVDATRNSATVQALLQDHQVLGLPSILFFTPDGRELRDARIEGELDQAGFLAWLDSRIEPNLR